jgi:hypothetical protein
MNAGARRAFLVAICFVWGRANHARRKPGGLPEKPAEFPVWRFGPEECLGEAYRTRRGFIYRSASCFSILGS